MSISGKEVALILSDLFNADEFNRLHSCLANAGALTSIVSDNADQKLQDFNREMEVTSDISYEQARGYDFKAVIISDGFSPDQVRIDDAALDFVRNMYDSDNIVSAIDHGAQVLISLGILKGKNVTGSAPIRVDLENAGAHYYDEPVVIDGNLITGRGQEDIGALCSAVIDELENRSEAAA